MVQNLLPKRAITRAGRSEHVGKMGVCGEFLGGGLATALSLTECRSGQPGITCAAVNNPVVDWVSLDDVQNQMHQTTQAHMLSTETTGSGLELASLSRLRSQLFTKPEKYFDPFASPILFFRSAGTDVPPTPARFSLDDMEHLTLLEREKATQQELTLDCHVTGPPQESTIADESMPAKRKASRRFPSKALGVRLPPFYISAGLAPPLRDQASELTRVLRQSFARQSEHASPGATDFGRKILFDEEEEDLDEDQERTRVLQNAEAEEKAQLNLHEGFGLWDDSTLGRARVLEVAKWLKDKLG